MPAEPSEDTDDSTESVGDRNDGIDGDSAESTPATEAVETANAQDGDRRKGTNEMFCRSCGAVIKKQAEICPECGVATEGGTRSGSAAGRAAPRGASGGSSSGKTKYLAGGIISGLIGFVLLPIGFGPIAMFCGYQVYQHHEESQGIALIGWGAVSLVVGMVFGAMVFGALGFA
jgi:hypothetical protein